MTLRLVPPLRAGLALALAVAVAPTAAHAQSPRSMMLELHVGSYEPDIDTEFSGPTPYNDIFGSDSVLLFTAHLDRQIYQGIGSFAIGGSLGYGWVDGQALSDQDLETDDETSLNLLPLKLTATYRFDWGAVYHGVPLVPYLKAGLNYTLWWVTNAQDDIANTRDPEGVARAGQGGTMGWHVGAGLQLLLDFFAPFMATEFDEEAGVNNSYLFAEYSINRVDDFGSDDSWNLGDDTLSFGLMFEF